MKRFYPILCAFVLLASLVSCGNQPSTPMAPSNSNDPPASSNDLISHDGVESTDPYAPSEPTGYIEEMDVDGDGEITAFESGIMYYNYGEMTNDRIVFRTQCFDALDIARTGLDWNTSYADILRNVYSLSGTKTAITGTIDWIQRDGFSTYLLVKTNPGNNIVSAYAYTDIPAIKGDSITIFGTIDGADTYTFTDAYGNVTQHDTFSVYIMDYFNTNLSRYGYSQTSVPADAVQGSPVFLETEYDYWFDRMYGEWYFTLGSISEKAYEIYYYCYDPEASAYVLFTRYTDILDFYGPDDYTVITLDLNDSTINTPENVGLEYSYIVSYDEYAEFIYKTDPVGWDWYMRNS